MSLFNELSRQVTLEGIGKGRLSLLGARDSILGKISGGVQGAFGNTALGGALGSIAANKAATALGGIANNELLGQADRGLSIAQDLFDGNFSDAGVNLLGSGFLDGIFFGASVYGSQARYLHSKNELFGGITPLQAKQIITDLQAVKFAKNNLFLLEISSSWMTDYDATRIFNLFCTSLNYSAQTISGDKRKIGGATIDAVVSTEPVELSLTTLDSKNGYLKQWFKDHAAATVSQDGTVGLPSRYAIKIKVIHSVIAQEDIGNGYNGEGLYRPGAIETSLSRHEHGLEEITMTFSQLDTCMGG